jgi:hypothetical protein
MLNSHTAANANKNSVPASRGLPRLTFFLPRTLPTDSVGHLLNFGEWCGNKASARRIMAEREADRFVGEDLGWD